MPNTSEVFIPLGTIDHDSSIGEVFELIGRVEKRLAQIHRLTMRETRLTPPQYFVLKLLWAKDARPFKELATECFCSRATMTGIVDGLEARGLVTRQPNPADRRSLLATLTEAGRALTASVPDLEQVYSQCCAGLDPDEFQQLGRLLQKLEASLVCVPPPASTQKESRP